MDAVLIGAELSRGTIVRTTRRLAQYGCFFVFVIISTMSSRQGFNCGRADGSYETTNGTNAILSHTGHIQWHSPAAFRVSCTIDVTYFPFDQQKCDFQFGSWTYNHREVRS